MPFERIHKLTAYLLAGLGLAALVTGDEQDPVFTGALLLAFVATWFAEGAFVARDGWQRTWNVIVVAALGVEALRVLRGGTQLLQAVVEFACILQISRLASRRRAWDYQQINILAMMHLIAGTVLNGGVTYALCFVGFVVVLPWALMMGHLRREVEGNYVLEPGPRASSDRAAVDVGRILRSRRIVSGGLLLGCAALSVPIFGMTATTFVLFPRVGVGLLRVQGGRTQTVAGLGDQVDLRGHGTIRDDPTIVVRIEPSDLPQEPPLTRPFRLRGNAFDHYDGFQWSRTLRVSERRIPNDGPLFPLVNNRLPDTERERPWRIVSDVSEPPVVLLPAGTFALRVEPRLEGGDRRYATLTRDALDEVHYRQAREEGGLSYATYLDPTLASGAGWPPLRRMTRTGWDRDRYLQLPPVSDALRDLARRWVGAETTPLGKALAIQRELRRFRYTLELENGQSEQPLENFLLRTHAGHCEYFSTALAVLLRIEGVPTRNVTGFLGGTWNRFGRFYAVRSGDAHSWVEVLDPQQGWLTFDPTPPGRDAASPSARGLGREIEAAMEALRMRWRTYVVGYDVRTQIQIAFGIRDFFAARNQRNARAERLRDDDPSRRRGGLSALRAVLDRIPWTLVAGVLLLVGIAAVVLSRSRTATEPGTSRQRQRELRRLQGLARAIDDTLARRGLPRAPHRSLLSAARELAERGDPAGSVALDATDRYQRARFGEQAIEPREIDAILRALRNVAKDASRMPAR